MVNFLVLVAVGFLVLLVIVLAIKLAEAKTPIHKVEQNKMFGFLSGMVGYTKNNSLNSDKLGDFYQETRVFKKDGVKISVNLSKDNDKGNYSFNDRKSYYQKMEKSNPPGSKGHSKATDWLKKNKGRN